MADQAIKLQKFIEKVDSDVVSEIPEHLESSLE